MMKRYNGLSSRLKSPGSGGRAGYQVPHLLTDAKDMLLRMIGRRGNHRAIIVGIVAGVIIASLVIVVVDFYRVKSLANFHPNVPTKIYDKNGILVAELFRQKREVVPLKRMPKDLPRAFVAIEDNEFY